MSYAYGMKDYPAVGNSIPGLPRRKLYDRFDMTWAVPGTYTWVVPDDFPFDSVCAVVVGSGGGPYLFTSASRASSGAGGGLAWANSINVTPGQSITIVVGRSEQTSNATAGTSYFMSASVCAASGGGEGTNSGGVAAGGVVLAGFGGSGGSGANGAAATTTSATGGGAGGYSGNGGNGVAATTNANGNAGSGGAGGSGGVDSVPSPYGSGGVGVFGEGASGAAGSSSNGGGGSGGSNGGDYLAGSFGAGGKVTYFSSGAFRINGVAGGHGCVRIIAGEGRAFPSTDTGQ